MIRVVTVLLWGLALLFAVLFFTHSGKHPITHGVTCLAISAVILICALLAPRAYRIADDQLIIQRVLFPIAISRLDVVGVERAEPGALSGAIRVCGIGGLYSSTGWFYKRGMGLFRAYVTDSSHAVIVATRKRKFVLSPADPTTFIECLQRSAY